MAKKTLNRETYLAWAREACQQRAPEPTIAETMAAERVHTLDLTARYDGAVLRLIAKNGGSLDLNLNAAQAIHLLRSLLAVGQAGGWMDAEGNAATDPPLDSSDDPQPVARRDPR